MREVLQEKRERIAMVDAVLRLENAALMFMEAFFLLLFELTSPDSFLLTLAQAGVSNGTWEANISTVSFGNIRGYLFLDSPQDFFFITKCESDPCSTELCRAHGESSCG